MSSEHDEPSKRSNCKKIAPHKHLWRDQGKVRGGWSYRCEVCGGSSRNSSYQEPAFREPTRRITSILFVGDGAPCAWEWESSK